MKMLILGTALILMLRTIPVSADEVSSKILPTQQAMESYSIGYMVGISIKNDGVSVEFEKLLIGMHDALDGKEPVLKMDVMKNLILDMKKRSREAALKHHQELIVKNEQESARFLEENAKMAGVKTTASGLQYKILQDGSGEIPKAEDRVTVSYRGTFINGQEFDRSPEQGDQPTVDVDGVIKGWTEALQMMKVGAKWRIFVPPALAYGINGLGQEIPPNKVLVFDIELLSVETKESDSRHRQIPSMPMKEVKHLPQQSENAN